MVNFSAVKCANNSKKGINDFDEKILSFHNDVSKGFFQIPNLNVINLVEKAEKKCRAIIEDLCLTNVNLNELIFNNLMK